MWELDIPTDAIAIGYRYLVEKLNLEVIPNYRWSYIAPIWHSKQFKYEDINLEVHLYPKTHRTPSTVLDHIEFALRNEGINLLILKQSLSTIDEEEVAAYIRKKPTGKYTRKLWFLYEFLLNKTLRVKDIDRGSYVELLDSSEYYTGRVKRSPRHRVLDNLLGNDQFSPIVRRSSRLKKFELDRLQEVVERITKRYSPEVLSRAIRYLYTKETIASWEIEREKPDKGKIARFVSLLQQDHTSSEMSKRFLVMIQKEIVDPRFVLGDYREFQNYVGEEPQLGEILVHFIPPKPENLERLMEGLLYTSSRMFSSAIDPVVSAAVLSFGFVYLHPFWDGNGRLHRFLIHYSLAKLGYAPRGILFPVSAVMLREHKEYDKALESFSKPLNLLMKEYEINENGEMTVSQETCDFFRYIDFTPIAEFLYQCVEKTIHSDLEEELEFLSRYDAIKMAVKEIVDMPDQKIDLFIRCVRQNGGTLSKRKRDSLFPMLTEKEIQQMEELFSRP